MAETAFRHWLRTARPGARYETETTDRADLCAALTRRLVRVKFGPSGVPVAVRLDSWLGETVS